MYTDFYHLKSLPFQLTPDHRFFFGSSVHNKAMAHLTYGLTQGEGFIIITGEVGAGKTTLVGYLLSTLDSDRYVAAKIVTTQLDGDNMLRMVASAFGIPQEGSDKATLLSRIEAFLRTCHEENLRCLLVVDEAQNLNIQALEELRMLSNILVDGQAPLQSFLLGQPQFRNLLASKDLDQLRQRVIASYHLGPLSEPETRSYIEHRLKTVGWANDPVIDDAAFRAIHVHTEGVPRKINTLCSRLLLYGFLEELHHLEGESVDQVADDLRKESEQVLPPGEQIPPVDEPEPKIVIGPSDGSAEKPVAGADHMQSDGKMNGSTVVTAADLKSLHERIEAIEGHVRHQERTLSRALQIVAALLESHGDEP